MNKIDETIEHHAAQCGWISKDDCVKRSAEALEANPAFFTSTDHQATVGAVYSIVHDFFPKHKGIFINHRIGTKKSGPFSVVKVHKPVFPNLKPEQKDTMFYEPLKNLGVKIVFNSTTNGYLFHIK